MVVVMPLDIFESYGPSLLTVSSSESILLLTLTLHFIAPVVLFDSAVQSCLKSEVF